MRLNLWPKRASGLHKVAGTAARHLAYSVVLVEARAQGCLSCLPRAARPPTPAIALASESLSAGEWRMGKPPTHSCGRSTPASCMRYAVEITDGMSRMADSEEAKLVESRHPSKQASLISVGVSDRVE